MYRLKYEMIIQQYNPENSWRKGLVMFRNMATLNKVSLTFLVMAKLSGFIGVSLGFLPAYHHYGGYLLMFSFLAIVVSIISAIFQTSLDKEVFSKEDEELHHIKLFVETKKKLEKQIEELEEKKRVLLNLKIRKGKYD